MPRTVPAMPTESPGNYNTGALFNATTKATGDFLLGSGSNGVPRFKGWASAAQTLASGTTDVAITLDTEDYDSDSGHSTSTNTSRYTVQVAGTYRITAIGGFANNATGNRKLGINLNGSNARGATVQLGAISTNSWCACVSVDLPLVVGDYVEMVMWQTSGGNLATAASIGFGPALTVCWISS